MDRVEPSEQQSNNTLQPAEKPAVLEVPAAIQSEKNRLETILTEKEIAPNLADEIRKKIEAIEEGKAPAVSSAELTEAIKKLEQAEQESLAGPNLTGDILADTLNGKLNLSEFELTQGLMAQTAKRYTEENKN